MTRLMCDRLGDVGLGQPDPKLSYEPDSLANATMPAALGCEVVFAEDRYPANLPLSDDQVRTLQPPPDIAAVFPMSEIIQQVGIINERHGTDVRPSWPTMGIQNIAAQTRGCGFFMDYHVDPELAKRLLDISERLTLSSWDYFILAGGKPEVFWNQNCTVPLVGPVVYEQHLLPYELALHDAAASNGVGFAIHHCGNFDEYAPLYRKAKNVAMLEIGWGSDLRLALDTFPEAKVMCIVGHQFVMDGPPALIRDTMRTMVETAEPDVQRVSFSISDLEHGTPDENVQALVEGLLPAG